MTIFFGLEVWDWFCVRVLGGGLLQHSVSLNTICHLSNVAMSTQFVSHDSDKTCNHCTFFPSQIKHVVCVKCH